MHSLSKSNASTCASRVDVSLTKDAEAVLSYLGTSKSSKLLTAQAERIAKAAFRLCSNFDLMVQRDHDACSIATLHSSAYVPLSGPVPPYACFQL
jgi:hypothetical protein